MFGSIIIKALIGGVMALVPWVLVISSIIALVSLILYKLQPKFVQKFTHLGAVLAISSLVTFVCLIIQVASFVAFVLTAQGKIDDLKKDKAGLEAAIVTKQAEIDRKETQLKEIDTSDEKTNTKYVPVYRTIEKLRTQPDLSLSNRLALELTVDFYKQDEVPNAPPVN